MLWKEIKNKPIRTFQLMNEPELIYIILIRSDEYIIVHEDAYDINTGKTEILNSEMIKTKYGIILS